MRNRMLVYLQPEIMEQVAELASRKKLTQSAVVEAAIMSFMSPDGTDRREAAFTRRLDKLTRQNQRLERNTRVTMEMQALFIRYLLNITPPLPPEAQAAMQAKGQERYKVFVESLGQRLQKGRSFLSEIPDDIETTLPTGAHDDGLESAS